MDAISEAPSKGNLGPTVLIIAWVFAALSIIVVTVRFWVRGKIVRNYSIADWIILLTLALGLGDSSFLTISVHWGLGRHVQTLGPENIMYTVKWVYLCEFFSIMSPCFGRISFVFLLLKIVPPAAWRRRFLWTIIAIQFVVDVGTVIISFSQCRPINKFWNPEVEGSCWSPKIQQDTGFFQGSVCSLVDLMLAVFPASLFWNLKMEWKVKLSLSILMGLGVFAMVASIVKTIELRELTEKGDPTHAMAVLAIWWTLEAYLVIIAASIPTLKPILRRTGNTTVGVSGGSSKMNTWRSKQPRSKPRNLSNGMSSSDEGPFYQLENTTPTGSNLERLPSDRKTIRKETTMEVTYEDAVSLENGAVGKW